MFSLTLIAFVLTVLSSQVTGLRKILCSFDDEVCLTKSGQLTYVRVMMGELSGVPSDPLHHDVIETNLPTIKYTLLNVTMTVMKNCTLKRLKIFKENLTYIYYIACPHFSIEAEYEVSGKLSDLPMDGKGTYKATLENYHIIFNGNYVKVSDENKMLHIQLTDYTLELEAKGRVAYEYKNLFDGDVKKSEDFHQHFSMENWTTVDAILGNATMNVFQRKIVDNFNKFLIIEPIQDVYYITE